MKRNKFNSLLKLVLFAFALAVVGTSCVKSREGFTDFSNLKPNVLISDGGMTNFGASAILFPPTDSVDTAFFHVNYAATNVAPTDETVTLAIDPAALAAYNASGVGLQYTLFPDSIFKFTSTTVTIPKGANYTAGIPLVIFPDKIDLLENYMLPITITVAPNGSGIAANYKTIYYHLIGNPIAGVYTQEWFRWNSSTNTGAPNFDVVDPNGPGVFAPQDGTTVTAVSGTGVTYIITFTDNGGGNLTNFQVAIDPASVSGITISAGPVVVLADPTTGTYEFQFNYINGSGSPRYIIDKFTK